MFFNTFDMKYSISIILPCYNVAQYIERAVNSILQQDFTDYEVIIVNDGSPDNLLKVCEKWVGKSNFTIVTTPNQGLSQARNEGLERAKGEYVYFMDPDDYINPGMFGEVMKNVMKEIMMQYILDSKPFMKIKETSIMTSLKSPMYMFLIKK